MSHTANSRSQASTAIGSGGTVATSPIGDGSHLAFILLRTVFTVAPILFGLDKFVGLLTDDWSKYLAPWMDNIIPGDAHFAMLLVGVVEVIAGIVVAVIPRFGGPLVAVWLLGIIVSLLSIGTYNDIALRDFGLLVAALALSSLAWGKYLSARSNRAA